MKQQRLITLATELRAMNLPHCAYLVDAAAKPSTPLVDAVAFLGQVIGVLHWYGHTDERLAVEAIRDELYNTPISAAYTVCEDCDQCGDCEG